jgi:peptidoglycan lytic transglycosylase
MGVRLGTAIRGAAIVLVCSNAVTARSEIRAVRSYGADSATIVGTASTYNPYQPGYREGGIETSSGEHYDPSAWAAAIQTNLREKFGGIRRGKGTSYALVEAFNKKAIVKINDVGPLKPGRIIDFDERTMRYFNPTLRLGLIHSVKVTPLQGDDWLPGPIAER